MNSFSVLMHYVDGHVEKVAHGDGGDLEVSRADGLLSIKNIDAIDPNEAVKLARAERVKFVNASRTPETMIGE